MNSSAKCNIQYMELFKEGQPNAIIAQNPRDGDKFIMPDGIFIQKNGTDDTKFTAQIQQCKERFNRSRRFLKIGYGLSPSRMNSSSDGLNFCLVLTMTIYKTWNSILLTGVDVPSL